MQILRSALLIPVLAFSAATLPLAAENFTVDASFQRSSFYSDFGRVNFARPDSQGRIYLAGELTGANGQRLGRVIRLLPNGTLDPTFAIGSTMASARLIMVDSSDRLLVGGSISGESQPGFVVERIVRFLNDGSVDPTFQTGPMSSGVDLFAETTGGKVLAYLPNDGTGFALKRLNSDGTLDPTFAPFVPFNGIIKAIPVTDANGKILLAGTFTTNFFSTYRGIIRLNADGSIDSTFTPPDGLSIPTINTEALGLQSDGKIILAGTRYVINGANSSFLRLNTNGTADPTFTATTLGSGIGTSILDLPRSLVVQPDNRIVVTCNRVVRVNANGEVDPTFTPPGTNVSSLLALPPHCLTRSPTGQLLLATANYFGRVNFSTGEPLGCVVSMNDDGTLTAGFVPPALEKESFDVKLTLQAGSWLAWGGFDRVNGAPASPVVRLLETGLADPNFLTLGALPLWQVTNSLVAIPGGAVFANFTEDSTNLVTRRATRFVRLSVNGGLELELLPTPPVSGPAKFFTQFGDRLLVSRMPTDGQGAVDGAPAVRRLLADGSPDPSFAGVAGVFEQVNRHPTTNAIQDLRLGAVDVLAVYPEGRFLATVASLLENTYRLVRFLPDGSVDPAFSTTAFETTLTTVALQIFEPGLGTNTVIATRPSTLGYGLADIGPDGSIVVFGSLNDATDNFLRPHLAKLQPSGANDPAFSVGTGPTLASGLIARVYRVRFAPDGKIWVLGNFDRFNGTVVQGIVRLLPNGTLDATATFPVGWLDFGGEGADIGFEVDGRVYLTGSYAKPGERIPFAVTKLQGTPLVPQPTATPVPIPPAATPTPTPTPLPTPTPTVTPTPGGPTPTPTPTPTPRDAYLRNVSTRLFGSTQNNVPIAGFAVKAGGQKVAVRVLGPTLARFGVTDVMFDPTVELRDAGGNLVATNDNFAEAGSGLDDLALANLVPSHANECALVQTLPEGTYTAVVRGKNGTIGNCLVEVYELAPISPPTRLINISTRGLVGTNDRVMIGGFVVGGDTPKRFLVRSLGPSLLLFGVPTALANPTIEVNNGSGVIASNDDWQDGAQAAEITASGLAPRNALEPAVIVTLGPGSYTAIVRGKDGTTGNALVEVYELP